MNKNYIIGKSLRKIALGEFNFHQPGTFAIIPEKPEDYKLSNYDDIVIESDDEGNVFYISMSLDFILRISQFVNCDLIAKEIPDFKKSSILKIDKNDIVLEKNLNIIQLKSLSDLLDLSELLAKHPEFKLASEALIDIPAFLHESPKALILTDYLLRMDNSHFGPVVKILNDWGVFKDLLDLKATSLDYKAFSDKQSSQLNTKLLIIQLFEGNYENANVKRIQKIIGADTKIIKDCFWLLNNFKRFINWEKLPPEELFKFMKDLNIGFSDRLDEIHNYAIAQNILNASDLRNQIISKWDSFMNQDLEFKNKKDLILILFNS